MMFYEFYNAYGTKNSVIDDDGNPNLLEIFEAIQSYKSKHNVIPVECFISKRFEAQFIKFEGRVIKLVPVEHLDFGRELWIGVNLVRVEEN